MTIKQLHEQFPFICKDELKYQVKVNYYKSEKGFLNKLSLINNDYKERSEKPDIVSMTIKIEWKKSRTWGYCPHAKYWVTYADGSGNWSRDKDYTASGCGYDKASTVIAQIFNDEFSGMLWRRRKIRKEVPYGISLTSYWFPHFDGGVGVSCYERIVEFLGGKWTHTAWGDTFDQYDIRIPTFTKKK